MKIALYLTLLTQFLFSGLAQALVNPDELDENIPGWIARLYIGTGTAQSNSLYCYGVLIDRKWVLSAVGCFNDPYRVLESYSTQASTQYSVRLGNSAEFIEVIETYRAPDAGVQLYELSEPVQQTPVVISELSGSQLYGRPVEVLGLDTSAGLGHAYYNPGTNSAVGSCKIKGATFFSSGALCYLFTYPIRHNKFLSAPAVGVDPLGNSRPDTALDDRVTPITTGERLYLKFNSDTTYSCMEDMGMPITITNSNGERELVGIVNIVGGAWSLPVCSGSIANRNTAVAYYRSFIEQSKIEAQFRAVCPAAPEVKVNYIGVSEVELTWDEVNNATGYTVHYSTASGIVPVKSLVLGAKTRVKTSLKPGLIIEASIQATNAECTSPISKRVYLKTPV